MARYDINHTTTDKIKERLNRVVVPFKRKVYPKGRVDQLRFLAKAYKSKLTTWRIVSGISIAINVYFLIERFM